LSTMRFDGVPSAPGLSAPPPGPTKLSSSPLEVVVDCLATNPTGGDSDRRMLGRSTAVRWSGQRTSSPPPHHPPTRSFVPLSRRRSSPSRPTGTVAVVHATPLPLVWRPPIAALLQLAPPRTIRRRPPSRK
jgi:hypothetical protein